jgi:hypothetical protein
VPIGLEAFSVKHLEIRNSIGSVSLSNLLIDTLSLSGRLGDYRITNCQIGTLVVDPGAVHDFDIRGGMVLDIQCPPPTGQSPFTGSVHFDRSVYLPRKPGVRLAGPQPYRNMRAHMLKLENAPMVTRFHSLEQAVERHNQSLFDRAISVCYGALSDYGSSTIRPVIWFLGVLLFTFVIVFVSDGAIPTQSVDPKGWQSGLAGEDLAARAERALVLTTGATVNPLGIFGLTGLLVARYGWLATWLPLHGLLSALCLVLLIFALRRRFEIT